MRRRPSPPGQPPSQPHSDVHHRLQRIEHLRPGLQPPVRIRELGKQEARSGARHRSHHVGRRQALGGDAAPGREMALAARSSPPPTSSSPGTPSSTRPMARLFQAALQHGLRRPDAYKVTGRHEITVDLPQPTASMFLNCADGRLRYHAGARLQGHQARGAAQPRRQHLARHLHGQDLGRQDLHGARRHRHRAVDPAGLRPGAQGL